MDWLASLAELGLEVAPDAVESLERLADELQHWNRRRNLTAITGRDEILEKHLLDSLTLLPLIKHPGRLLDIGSGAGFPALPLKIARPDLEVVSVDAVGKKVDFQRHVARVFGLKGFTVLHERIESLVDHADFHQSFEMVTARALCTLGELQAMAKPFLVPGGRLLAMKGPGGDQEIDALDGPSQGAGEVVTVHRLKLPVSGASRCLIEIEYL
jgi:16S rRNA (guanine527-N7)-methyltransferase